MKITITATRLALLDLCARAERTKAPCSYRLDARRAGHLTIGTKDEAAIELIRTWHQRNAHVVLEYTEL